MRQRLEPILAKLNGMLGGVWAHLGLLKYLLTACVLSALALVVSLVIWSRVRPISKYLAPIESHLKAQLNADEFRIKAVAWAWEWQTFSIGIQAKEAYYKDLARGIEGAIPNLRIMWSPIKLLVGSISLTAHVDNSTWQIGEKEFSGSKDSDHTPLLKGLTQPNFWQRRWDAHIDGKALSVSAAIAPGNPVLLSDVNVSASLLATRSYFDGVADAKISKNSDLGSYDGRLALQWKGAFQYVDKALVGISVDSARVDFSHSVVDGWGLYKGKRDPLRASFGVQMLVNEDGDFTTVDVKDGKLKFADLNFAFDGDQKNANGAAFKWILENQQLNKNKLPFQVIHQAKASGPVQAEGRVEISSGWDFSALWSLRANGISFNAIELADQFDSRSEGSVVFNLAFDGGFENGAVHSSGFQLKLDAKDALLVSKSKAFTKPTGQAAQIQVMFDVNDDVLTLKPSFFEWASFRAEAGGKIENVSDYLLRGGEAPFQFETHTTKLDISKIAPLLSFLKQNPVPSGILEFSGAASGSLGKKSLAQQFEDRELAWRIDQLSLADFTAAADTGAWFAKQKEQGYSLDGVVRSDLSLRARGRGYLVQTSSLQAKLDMTNAEVVWADRFRKPLGIPGKLQLGLSSVPNKIEFKSSHITFLDNDIDFSGVLNQGARSRIALSLRRPIDLSKWRGFFRIRDNMPLQGLVQPKLYLSLLTLPEQMDSGIDWRRVGVSGSATFSNLRGVLGALSVFDQSSGTVSFSDGKIGLQKLKTRVEGQELTLDGAVRPRGQRGDVSFYDLASAKGWDLDLAVSSSSVDLPKLFKGLNPKIVASGERERSKNSLEPRTWLNPEEIGALRQWTLLGNLNLKSRWNVKRLKFGTWTLVDVKGGLGLSGYRFKYNLSSGTWLHGSQLSGAGAWDIKPKGNSTQGMSFAGTWNWKQAPLGELLGMWDLRESKIYQGLFSGSLTYAIEKFETANTDELTRINFDGLVKDTTHKAMQVVAVEAQDLLKGWGLGKSCFAPQWNGTFKAWSSGDGALRVDEAKWASSGAANGSRISWSASVDQSERAEIKGQWFPSAACLGPKVDSCWKAAGANLGSFELSGEWDKLALEWKPASWDMVTNCLASRGSKSSAKNRSFSDDKAQKDRIKTYLQKNAN